MSMRKKVRVKVTLTMDPRVVKRAKRLRVNMSRIADEAIWVFMDRMDAKVN